MKSRADRITEFRVKQPIAELKRKFEKIRHSRHRKNYWTAEELDLADAEATEMYEFFNSRVVKESNQSKS